jgi:serine/threonine protein kinase
MMIGSMGFMAPEQISGNPGPEADVFAWGVTVAYAAGGRSPFGAGSTHSVLYRIMYGDAEIASVPDSLLPLVEASLAKDPQSRPSARQLLDRLTSGSSRAGSADHTTQVILARTWQSGSHPSPPAASAAPAAAATPAGWPYAARPGAGSPAAAPAAADDTDAPTADSPSSAPPAAPAPAPEKVPVGRRMATIATSALAAMRFRRSSRPADPKQ